MAQISNEAEPKQYKTGGWSAHYILIICTLLYMINYVDRQVFSAVLQPMKVELGLTDAQCGMAQTFFMLGMALFSFPISYLIDRWSRKKAIAIMAILWSGLTYLTGLGATFIGVLIPRSMVGVGEAGFTAGGTAMTSAAYSKQARARALGVFNIAIPLGAAIGTMVGGAISVQYGWRMPFFIFAIPGIILGILALFMKDYKTAAPSSAAGKKVGFGHSIASVLSIPTLRWYYIGYGILTFTGTAVLSWLPAYVMRTMNVTEGQAGLIVGGMVLMAIIGAPLGGYLADFWQKRNNKGRIYLASLSAVLSAILLIAVVLIKFNTIGIIIGMLYGIFNVMGNPALASVSQDVVPSAHKGLSFGIAVFCAYALGGAWGPFAVGGISDALGGGANGLSIALIISSAGALLGGLFLLFAARHYGPDMEKVQRETLLAES
jgi:MFS family permease